MTLNRIAIPSAIAAGSSHLVTRTSRTGSRANNLRDFDITEIASAVYDFLSATRRLMERPNMKLGVSQSEVEVLQFISQHPGCGVSDIARLRFLRASNVSATVRRLLNAGLLTRQANTDDRRAQDLHLTEQGETVMHALSEEWARLIMLAARHMDGRDIAKLRRGVPALKNLSAASEHLIEDIQRRNSA